VGDDIFVTGTLGDSALGLKLLKGNRPRPEQQFVAQLLQRHHQPTPRIMAGALLARQFLATAMIDVSDGLLQDLEHVCRASRTGAVIFDEQLPLSPAYRACTAKDGTRYALSGGEDYELLFCARPQNRARIENLEQRARVRITRIGTCVPAKKGIIVIDGSGKSLPIRFKGHDHFEKRQVRRAKNT
jgi:thiamine-monophosphate kinase